MISGLGGGLISEHNGQLTKGDDRTISSATGYLRLESISHWFEKDGQPFEVLRDINLKIRKNEFVSIVGPSGCGKSTLLYIIAGFIAPTEGKVWHAEEEVRQPSRKRGVVFQADAVFPWLTIADQL